MGNTGLIDPVTYHIVLVNITHSLTTCITTGPHYQSHTNTTPYNVLTTLSVVFMSMYLVFISVSTVATSPLLAAITSWSHSDICIHSNINIRKIVWPQSTVDYRNGHNYTTATVYICVWSLQKYIIMASMRKTFLYTSWKILLMFCYWKHC